MHDQSAAHSQETTTKLGVLLREKTTEAPCRQGAMMKSGKPSKQLVTRREALAAGGAVALFTSAGAGADTHPVEDHHGEFVSVKDFGAVGDGVADDTAAIQAALNAAKGADKTAVGRSVFSLYFPSVPGGFYRVTDTLVIDGTHGLVIYGDGALTEREAQNATIRWYGTASKPVFQVKGGTGIPSNPNFSIAFR
ncbi:MAG: hypothetical protein ISR77_36585, partial [Pirellulaceae bacterium]|nr:hypothetical protein [Pirellulaceae bacterium]